MKASEAKQLRLLQEENHRLKKAVADLTLEKQILKEEAEGVSWQPNLRNACVSQESNPGFAQACGNPRAARTMSLRGALARVNTEPLPEKPPTGKRADGISYD